MRIFDIGFKGDRTYIHGTDIIDTLRQLATQTVDDLISLDVTIRTRTSKQLVLNWGTGVDKDIAKITFSFTTPSTQLIGFLSEHTSSPSHRREFDESIVKNNSQISPDLSSINYIHETSLTSKKILTSTEIYTILAKHLLTSLSGNSHWLFARAIIAKPSEWEGVGTHTISLASDPHFKLVKLNAIRNNSILGNLICSRAD